MKFNFVYDEENDVLSIFSPNCKSKESIEFSENIIFDINKNGNLVALQILDASEFFSSLNEQLTREFLSNLESIELIEKEYRNNWFIVIGFKSKNRAIIQQPMPLLRKSEYKSLLLCN
jgi:uncharacterized protein YuzE